MAIVIDIERKLDEWVGAQVLDTDAAVRLRAYEASHAGRHGRWLVVLAIGFGVLMLAAGVLLFVAAHWDRISPTQRFLSVLAMVAIFHLAAGFIPPDQNKVRIALHGVGTISLGAGVFLAGQIFNLEEHWPGGIMLWALGALLGWLVLRDWLQALLLALLGPAWVISEWIERTERLVGTERLTAMTVLGLSLVYFTAVTDSQPSPLRRALRWVGGILAIPMTIALFELHDYWWRGSQRAPWFLAYIVGLGVALAIACWIRRRFDWWTAGAMLWVAGLSFLSAWTAARYNAPRNWADLSQYAWCALGSAGMIAWGMQELRRERINMGVAGFALTVCAFYFSGVMDKLGRSVALMLFGALFLAGGYFLEKGRRRLLAHMEEGRA